MIVNYFNLWITIEFYQIEDKLLTHMILCLNMNKKIQFNLYLFYFNYLMYYFLHSMNFGSYYMQVHYTLTYFETMMIHKQCIQANVYIFFAKCILCYAVLNDTIFIVILVTAAFDLTVLCYWIIMLNYDVLNLIVV